MEHPFFPTTTTRAEALRWLSISEKLLATRDLLGSKSFATRARDSDPTLSHAEQILAIVDTLLVGDSRIGNTQDWYAILRLTPQQGRDTEVIANQYRNLALTLNPQRNKYPFAEQAFRLVVDAWSVLSNPSSKSIYDKELAFYLHPQQHQPDPFHNPIPTLPQNFMFFGASGSSSVAQPQVNAGGSSSGGASHFSQVQQEQANNKQKQPLQDYPSVSDRTKNNANADENAADGVNMEEVERGGVQEEEKVDAQENDRDLTFWTACPYCYYMYEYSRVYADCTLRCQHCRRAFQAVVIPSPPPILDGQEGYFCCWGFLPLGISMENWEKNKASSSAWTPFSPMFTCPRVVDGNKKGGRKNSSAPRIYVDDDEVFVEISDSSESDDEWQNNREIKKKKAKNVKGKVTGGTSNRSAKKVQVDKGKSVNVEDGIVSPNGVEIPVKTTGEPSKKGATTNARKQPGRVAKNYGKLDLNVEFSNETEESVTRVNQGNGPGRGEDDNIEGIGFFEGLDEFLNSLPILNGVGDDKVVKAA